MTLRDELVEIAARVRRIAEGAEPSPVRRELIGHAEWIEQFAVGGCLARISPDAGDVCRRPHGHDGWHTTFEGVDFEFYDFEDLW